MAVVDRFIIPTRGINVMAADVVEVEDVVMVLPEVDLEAVVPPLIG